jgi:pyrimidine operon attenuation protein/uracil phosphoribosyltransferase
MAATKTQILTDTEVTKMLKRLAFQVYERNSDQKELIIAGIKGPGTAISRLLCEELSNICKIKLRNIEIQLDKDQYGKDNVSLSEKIDLEDKCVVVVDDVLNTARTFVYALLPFIGTKTRRIQTLVLVDRNHRSFPVSADYIGISLSTTLQEHVHVVIDKKKVNIYLT